ncbi:hypothetical protein [Ectothiorhodospira mobilis]|nr:hypothetical protein [Ectothiorhodospira mobilis]
MIRRIAAHPPHHVPRRLHYSYRTEQAHIYWIRFIFSGKRRPREMGKEVSAILRRMRERYWLMAIVYGRGLRAAEWLPQIDTHVLQRGGGAVRGPVDALLGSGGCPEDPACTARPSFFFPSP